MLQFITYPQSSLSPSEQALAALRGGCEWIEINMPGASYDELHAEVEKVRPEAEKRGAFLIITDHVDWVKDLNVGGVRLTDGAVSPGRARVLIGAAGVIGVNASTFDDAERVRNADVDFIALAPFRGNNAIGIDGIKEIVAKMHDTDLQIPTVALGGVKTEDITELLAAGVNGIAMSSAIATAPDPEAMVKSIISSIGHP